MEEHGAEEGRELDVTFAGKGYFVNRCKCIGMRATDSGELGIETLFVRREERLCFFGSVVIVHFVELTYSELEFGWPIGLRIEQDL